MVLLPAPLGPIRPRISPAASCKANIVDGHQAAERSHAVPPTPAAACRRPACVRRGSGRRVGRRPAARAAADSA